MHSQCGLNREPWITTHTHTGMSKGQCYNTASVHGKLIFAVIFMIIGDLKRKLCNSAHKKVKAMADLNLNAFFFKVVSLCISGLLPKLLLCVYIDGISKLNYKGNISFVSN